MDKRRVLIVDDETGLTRMVKLTLERTNRYEVREENNAATAVATAREYQPDVIILDVVMPGQDGGQVLAQLRADTALQKVPVIFLTATMDRESVKSRHGQIGGQPLLAKPVDLKELTRGIEQALKQAGRG
jgi:DNA-binding response OmpR family regulator